MAEVGGVDYFGPDFLGTEIDFEQPMTADAIKVRRDLCAFYALPENCLLSRVPPILRAVDDHVLFPFSPHWSGTRWVRVSNFCVLKQVCFKFRKILKDKTIMMFVMPYTPLLDAYLIHQLIDNPGRIQTSDDEDAADANEGQALPVSGRCGVLKLPDPHTPDGTCRVQLRFTVINYGLLWAKASEHLEFIGTCNQSKELIGQLEGHQHYVMQDPNNASSILNADHLLNLEESIEATKLDFLLSLYKHGMHISNSVNLIVSYVKVLHQLTYLCYPRNCCCILFFISLH